MKLNKINKLAIDNCFALTAYFEGNICTVKLLSKNVFCHDPCYVALLFRAQMQRLEALVWV